MTIAATGLDFVDWAILGVYAATTIFLGWWFGRKQKTAKEYFVGSGTMSPILIGVSLFATLLSTISYRSMPGESLGKGPVYMANYLAYPFIFVIVGFVLLPVYMRQKVTSAYELLEARLGLSIRLLGAILFLLLRLVWMSLLVYLTAEALAIMMNVDKKWIPLIVLITGFIAIVYTSLGGLRAVVVTDLMQTILLYGGALLVIGTVSWEMGGFSWFPTEWNRDVWGEPPDSIFPDSIKTRVSLFGSFLSVLIWYVATSGGDQVSVQRFMATRDARSARRAIGMQLIVGAVVGITLGIVGFALLGYFEQLPEQLRNNITVAANADDIFPFYIADHLPPVVSGLVLAGLFAAAMSSIDSGVNSITAVVTTDFIDRFRLEPVSEERRVLIARIIAFSVGGVVVAASTLMDKIPGNITAVTNKTVNLLTVPIFCLFFFALFVKFSKPAAVWIATVVSILVAATIAFSGPLVHLLHHLFEIDPAVFGTEFVTTIDKTTGLEKTTVNDPISFQWITPAALVVNFGVGLLLSLILKGRPTNPEPSET